MVKFETYERIEKALELAYMHLSNVKDSVTDESDNEEINFQTRINKVLEEIEYLREEQIFTLQIKPEE